MIGYNINKKLKILAYAFLIIFILLFFLPFFFISPSYSLTVREPAFEKVNKYLVKELKKANVPGTAISIVDNKGVLFSNVYGNTKSIHTPFIIGSVSKSFTALAIMQLVEQNKLQLENSISTYIDETIIDKKIGDSITVKDLLNQTSGIEAFETTPINLVNNKSFEYSNVNYDLLGKIITKVSGVDFKEYFQSKIFTPLKMSNTYTSIKKAKENGFVSGYQNYFGFPIRNEVYYPDEIASGYIISSAYDMSNYLKMYLNKGSFNGNPIVTKTSINMMQYKGTNSTGSEIGKEMFSGESIYGMGWVSKNLDGKEIIYHSGKVENSSSICILLPRENLGITMFFNQLDFLVSQNMIEKIQEGVVSILLNENPESLAKTAYFINHNIINLMYFILILLSCAPLILLKRWKRCFKAKGLTLDKIFFFILAHVVSPLIITLVLPLHLAIRYVPDFALVLLISVILLILTGIYKVFWLLINRKSIFKLTYNKEKPLNP